MSKIGFIAPLVLLAAAIATAFFVQTTDLTPLTDHSVAIKSSTHDSAYMSMDMYYTIPPEPLIQSKVFGGIVSHHFLAQKDIARLFFKWQGQDYKTVVIIGPNHFNPKSEEFIVSKQAFKTPWGRIEPDLEVINALIKTKIVSVEEKTFDSEHSITTLTPFIRRSFPNAKIVPIIARMKTKTEGPEFLGERLADILGDDALVLVSADFTHEATESVAKKNDELSAQILSDLDTERIDEVTADGREGLRALFAYLNKKGATKFDYWHSSSTIITGNMQQKDVTSYMFGWYGKE
jgi:hypothetical protein